MPEAGQPPAADPLVTEPGPQEPLETEPDANGGAVPTDPGGAPGADQPQPGIEPEEHVTGPEAGDGAVTDEGDDLADPVVRGAADDDGAAADGASPRQERLTLSEMEEILDGIGVDDGDLFFGAVVRAGVEDGGQIAMLVAPEDLQAETDGGADQDEFASFRADLEEAGFTDVQQDIDWFVMEGIFDDHTIFIMEAADAGGAAGTAEEEAAGADELDQDALRGLLGDAGIEIADDGVPKLFRADYAGRTVFLILTDMDSGTADLSEEELRERFEAAGLEELEDLGEEMHIMSGQHDGRAVLVLGNVEALRDSGR